MSQPCERKAAPSPLLGAKPSECQQALAKAWESWVGEGLWGALQLGKSFARRRTLWASLADRKAKLQKVWLVLGYFPDICSCATG